MNIKDCPPIRDFKFYRQLLKSDFSDITNIYPTPIAIYFKERIEKNVDFIKKPFNTFAEKEFFFALKANYNPAILKIIKNKGFGAEVMSEFELKLALKIGFNPLKIVFNGVGKTDDALKLAVNKKIKYIIIDSLSEAKKISVLGKNIRVLIRCHPSIDETTSKKLFVSKDSKLGLSLCGNEIMRVIDFVIKNNFSFEGFSFNVAARQRDLRLHELALIFIISFYNSLDSTIKKMVQVIDIGGGFDSPLFINKNISFTKGVPAFFNKNNIKLIVEPGRSIINDSCIFITKVITNKNTDSKRYAVVDVATNYLIPLPLSYYPVISQKKAKKLTYSVVDGICSTAGVINASVELPKVNEGENLIILNCGAYTYNMFEHFYDLRPTVLLVDGKKKVLLNKKQSFNSAFKFFTN